MTIRMGLAAVALFVTGCTSAPASAPEAAPATAARAADAAQPEEYPHLSQAAWEKVRDHTSAILTDGGASRLTFIAYHNVAADLCDGIATDTAKVEEAIHSLHPENWDALTEDQRRDWNNTLLTSYGMTYGVQLAEHAGNTAPFCAQAKALAADSQGTPTYFASAAPAAR